MTKASYQDFIEDYSIIKRHSEFTKTKLKDLREELDAVLKNSVYKEKITIVTTGSYARDEASDESDIDLFIFFDSDHSKDLIKSELSDIEQIINKHVPNNPGDTGTFGTDVVIQFSELIENIGGEYDTNKNMTRRVLLLLEGAWLYGEHSFKEYRTQLLTKYLSDEADPEDIPRFFLNDIIRYYRTITTDFAHKVSKGGQSWGLRSVKLRYSRKLLYFGGIITVAASVGEKDKIKRIETLLKLPALERIYKLKTNSDTYHSNEVFAGYEEFLKTISNPVKRGELKTLSRDDRKSSETYQNIRAESKAFSCILSKWLESEFNSDHLIHNSLLF